MSLPVVAAPTMMCPLRTRGCCCASARAPHAVSGWASLQRVRTIVRFELSKPSLQQIESGLHALHVALHECAVSKGRAERIAVGQCALVVAEKVAHEHAGLLHTAR